MLPPRTDWAETIPPGEEAELVALAEVLRELQAKQAKKGGMGRALHYKAHAGVRAELTTRAGLPAPYAVGIFAGAARYPAYVRFSNGASRAQPDRTGDVRGLALKVVGVPGKKLIPGLEDRVTQDFLMIKTPSTPFRHAREFVRVLQAAASPLQLVPTLFRLGPGRTLGLLRQLLASLKAPVPTVAPLRYWSALPTQWGAYAARTSLTPVDTADLAGHGAGEHALRGDLGERLRAGPLRYTLSAQLYVDPRRTPIEDASVDWAESDSPYLPIADLVIPQQDVASELGRRIDAYVEKLSFDPWHAPTEFRPLGNMMRARNHAYRLSTIARGASPEPDGSETWG